MGARVRRGRTVAASGGAIDVVLITGTNQTWEWVRQTVDETGSTRVRATANTPESGLAVVSRYRPDVVVVDAGRLLAPGESLLASIRAIIPASAIVAIGADEEGRHLRERAPEIGILGWPELSAQILVAAIAGAAAGLVVSAPGVIPETRSPAPPVLSRHQREVAEGFWRDLSEADIANRWDTSDSTVRRALRALKDRLHAEGLFKLGALAERAGLLPESDFPSEPSRDDNNN